MERIEPILEMLFGHPRSTPEETARRREEIERAYQRHLEQLAREHQRRDRVPGRLPTQKPPPLVPGRPKRDDAD